MSITVTSLVAELAHAIWHKAGHARTATVDEGFVTVTMRGRVAAIAAAGPDDEGLFLAITDYAPEVLGSIPSTSLAIGAFDEILQSLVAYLTID